MTLGEELYARCKRNYDETYFPDGREFDEDPTFEQEFIGTPGGCFAENSVWENYDEESQGVWDKFYAIYGFLRDQLQAEAEYMPTIVIDTNWDDLTRVLITYKRVVLVEDFTKAWNFYWNSREEMYEFLEKTYRQMQAMVKLADDINIEALARGYMEEKTK